MKYYTKCPEQNTLAEWTGVVVSGWDQDHKQEAMEVVPKIIQGLPLPPMQSSWREALGYIADYTLDAKNSWNCRICPELCKK